MGFVDTFRPICLDRKKKFARRWRHFRIPGNRCEPTAIRAAIAQYRALHQRIGAATAADRQCIAIDASLIQMITTGRRTKIAVDMRTDAYG